MGGFSLIRVYLLPTLLPGSSWLTCTMHPVALADRKQTLSKKLDTSGVPFLTPRRDTRPHHNLFKSMLDLIGSTVGIDCRSWCFRCRRSTFRALAKQPARAPSPLPSTKQARFRESTLTRMVPCTASCCVCRPETVHSASPARRYCQSQVRELILAAITPAASVRTSN